MKCIFTAIFQYHIWITSCFNWVPLPTSEHQHWFQYSPHKGQWHGALMLSLNSAWTTGWINNRDAGDLRSHRTHYYVTLMWKRVLMAWGWSTRTLDSSVPQYLHHTEVLHAAMFWFWLITKSTFMICLETFITYMVRGSMIFIWVQFHKRYLSLQSLKLGSKVLV